MLEMDVLVKPERETMLQFLARRIEQQDAEHLVVDQSAYQFGDTAEQLIEVQDRRKFARDFIQQQKNPSLLCRSRVELRVFDAGRHARGNQRQYAQMLFGESARLARFDV